MRSILIAISLVLTACAFTKPGPQLSNRAAGATMLVIADAQFHNVHGLGLKQMLPVADFVSNVAIRPPELNLLAPMVLDELLRRGLEAKPEVLLVLGDISNIGCSQEVASFLGVIDRRRPRTTPMIMAHGNHDTYLMGTVNHFFPTDDLKSWKGNRLAMGESPVPTDESWWGEIDSSADLAQPNWRDGCFHPAAESSPMNKSRWLAKYIASLEPQGLVKEPIAATVRAPTPDRWGALRGDVSSSASAPFPIKLSSAAGTPLGNIHYKAAGQWHPPVLLPVPSQSYFTVTYRSFIVQKIVVQNTALIVIDTSLCERAFGGVAMPFTNAGTRACLGDEQLRQIVAYIDEVPKDQPIALGGHYPMEEMTHAERAALHAALAGRERWVYLSAHTHGARSTTAWGAGLEVNFGSTTDWPMEVSTMGFSGSFALPSVNTLYNSEKPPLTYLPTPSANHRFEVCRHLPAAKHLAELVVADSTLQWQSPAATQRCEVDSRAQWQNESIDLEAFRAIIHSRFNSDSEPAYRRLVLDIAAAASKYENGRFSILDPIP